MTWVRYILNYFVPLHVKIKNVIKRKTKRQ